MIQKAIVIAQKGSKIIFATEPEKLPYKNSNNSQEHFSACELYLTCRMGN